MLTGKTEGLQQHPQLQSVRLIKPQWDQLSCNNYSQHLIRHKLNDFILM